MYINRNQIGAVVGSQPFGGEGLSGTGPKAGGPHYLSRFRKREVPVTEVPEAPLVEKEALTNAIATLDGREWSARLDRIGTLRRALRGAVPDAMAAAAALEQGPIDLPGPTGESNRWNLAPRGIALCLGPTDERALEQAVQALATGNAVVAISPDAHQAFVPLLDSEFPVTVLNGRIEPNMLVSLLVDCVASAGGDLAALRQALSAREGAIVPLITERLQPFAYTHERAVCVDTTASGGNAALLAKVGGEDVRAA